jgi:Galactose oxidase, central domain
VGKRMTMLAALLAGASLTLAGSSAIPVTKWTWTQLHTPERPPGRVSAIVLYDSREDRTFLFGGDRGDGNSSNDTWVLDFANRTWKSLRTTASPPPGYLASGVFDSRVDRIFVFGGLANAPPLRDTWSFDPVNETWTNLTSKGAPSPRFGIAAAYDEGLDRVVLYGGYGYAPNGTFQVYTDTWLFDPESGVWTNVTMTSTPPPLGTVRLFFDPHGRQDILIGIGNEYYTWSFNGTTRRWTNVTPAYSPGPRYVDLSSTYDSLDGEVIIVARAALPEAPDHMVTWGYRPATNAWSLLPTIGGPTEYTFAGLTFDGHANHSILFGGGSVLAPSNETWVLGEPLAVSTTAVNPYVFPIIVGGCIAVVALALYVRKHRAKLRPR